MATERWEVIRALVATLGRAEVRVGVVGEQADRPHRDSNLTIGEIAMLHELGNPSTNLPERSFVRATLRDPAVRARLLPLQRRLFGDVINGRTSRDHALAELGRATAAEIRRRLIDNQIRPELAASTIAAKGDDTVLVETGQLADAIGWEIRK